MNAYYFLRDKTAIWGAKKAQLPFSEGKYQLLNSCSLGGIKFRSLQFSII